MFLDRIFEHARSKCAIRTPPNRQLEIALLFEPTFKAERPQTQGRA